MEKMRWSRVNRTVVTLLFAVSVSVACMSQPLMAEPINGGTWEKISSPEMEAALGSVGVITSIVEYNGKVYAGGKADPDDTGDYPAVVYAGDADGDMELVSPDFGMGADSYVAHMAVFDNKLYASVVDFGFDDPMELWVYNSATDTWAEDSKYTLDDEQANVSSFIDPVTGKYASVELDDSCSLDSASAAAESGTTKDAGYDYQAGLVSFEATCDGGSTTVKIYQYGADIDSRTLRKYNPDTNAYFTVDDVSLSTEVIDGQQVAVATYTIVDNGPLDLNPAVGTISDPVGLANQAVGAPNTGLGGHIR